MTTITATEAIAAAEQKLKDLIKAGVTGQELDDAEDALGVAKLAAAQTAERALTRSRLQAEVNRQQQAEARANRERAAEEAEQEVESRAPVVTITYGGITVRIRLRGGRDHTARLTCEHAVTCAIRLLNRMHLEDIGRARSAALGVEAPVLEDTTFVLRRLEDELRHARALDAVEEISTK